MKETINTKKFLNWLSRMEKSANKLKKAHAANEDYEQAAKYKSLASTYRDIGTIIRNGYDVENVDFFE